MASWRSLFKPVFNLPPAKLNLSLQVDFGRLRRAYFWKMKTISRLLGLALVLGMFGAAMTTEAAEKKKAKAKQLRHFVCFKYKAEVSKEKIAEVEKAFVGLEKKIKEIKGFEKGLNNSPEGLNKGFKHCYMITFNSEKARDAYLVHPDHKKFVELVGPVLEDVFVVDYWADK